MPKILSPTRTHLLLPPKIHVMRSCKSPDRPSEAALFALPFETVPHKLDTATQPSQHNSGNTHADQIILGNVIIFNRVSMMSYTFSRKKKHTHTKKIYLSNKNQIQQLTLLRSLMYCTPFWTSNVAPDRPSQPSISSSEFFLPHNKYSFLL